MSGTCLPMNLSTPVTRLARKNLCDSRAVDMLEKVIGAYIEKSLQLIGGMTDNFSVKMA